MVVLEPASRLTPRAKVGSNITILESILNGANFLDRRCECRLTTTRCFSGALSLPYIWGRL